MIPPLLMDLHPGMTVLDMCAAPGSKSAQLLEMIHVGEEARMRKVLRQIAEAEGLALGKETKEEKEADLSADPSDDGRATGLLIANDSDYKRGHMLVHQLKRLSSPNLIVTNHDATQFPSIRLPSDSKQPKFLKFDRILADVPCSGDGTLRKNANLWKDWSPGSALGLHALQIRILVRALQLLKVGGRVVYSTCSMNPCENESVIAAAIERCGGADTVDIIDCKDKLPNLKRNDGMKTWKIMDKTARIWGSWAEVEAFAEQNEGTIPGRICKSMFPKQAGEEGADLPLDRCMRVYPHFQDTGGFFITVLEKKKDFRAKDENGTKEKPEKSKKSEESKVEADGSNGTEEKQAEPTKPEETVAEVAVATKEDTPMDDASMVGEKRALDSEEAEEQQAKKVKTDEQESSTPATPAVATPAPPANQPALKTKKPGQNNEEPFKYLDPSHSIIQNIKEFYHLSSRFPDNRYMVRNETGEPAKAIYYTSALLRDIFTENDGRGIKFIHGGVRMYMKQEAPSAEVCRWRIQAEGMPILQGYVGETRVVRLHSKETFHKLLIEMFPRVSEGNWQKFNEIGETVRDIGMGCCVLKVEPEGDDPDFSESMALPLWKSVQSLNLMLPKEDRAAMLLRIYNDSSPLINMPLLKDKQQQEQQQQSKEAEKNVTKLEETEGDTEVESKEEVSAETNEA